MALILGAYIAIGIIAAIVYLNVVGENNSITFKTLVESIILGIFWPVIFVIK